MKKLNIYGLGGAGVNILNQIDIQSNLAGFPEASLIQIDSNKSNISKFTNPEVKTHLIPGIKGAGKVQKVAFRAAQPYLDKILSEDAPAENNIIISSISGGTGSPILALMVSEFQKRDVNFVVIGINGIVCYRSAKNTASTLNSLQGVCRVNKKPCVLDYYSNADSSEEQINNDILDNINGLAMLFSGDNSRLDNVDLHNFFDYTTVLEDVNPTLVHLHQRSTTEENFGELESELAEVGVITMASLYPEESEVIDTTNHSLYECYGILPEGISKVSDAKNLHFFTTVSDVNDAAMEVSNVVAKYQDIEDRINANTVMTGDTNDEGFAFD